MHSNTTMFVSNVIRKDHILDVIEAWNLCNHKVHQALPVI